MVPGSGWWLVMGGAHSAPESLLSTNVSLIWKDVDLGIRSQNSHLYLHSSSITVIIISLSVSVEDGG